MKRTIGYLVATTLAACNAASDDAVASDGDAESATDITGSPSGTTTPTPGDATALGTSDDGGEESGGNDEADATGTNDPSDDGPGAEAACEDVDCGPSGSCVELDDGTVACDCEKPTVAAGLQCFTCTAVSGEYDIDVRATDVTVSLLLSGETPPQIGTEIGELWLRNPATDEMITLGTTHSSVLTTRVVPTGYEIVYRRRHGSLVPANRNAVVGIVDAKNVAQVAVDIDLDVQRFEGDISFDGEPAPASVNENGRLWLRKASTGDEVFLGETRAGSFSVNVLPGAYDIEYESLASGATAPRNHRAQVDTVVIPEGRSEVAIVHPINITTTVIEGDFLVDGAAAPGTTNERARVSLRDTVTGDEFLLGETVAGDYSLRVVPGQYEIVYEWLTGTAVMPSNPRAVIGTIDTFVSTVNDVAIDTVVVSGGFTIDGAPPPNDPADDGRISLRGSTPDDEILLGNTTSGSFQRIVLPGVYTVRYAQDTSSVLAPANSDAELEAIDVAAAPTFDVDVPTAFVSGIITLADSSPRRSCLVPTKSSTPSRRRAVRSRSTSTASCSTRSTSKAAR